MQSKLAYAAGILGMAVLGAWITFRRNSAARQCAAGLPALEIDDDAAANLITRYRPAVERALAGIG